MGRVMANREGIMIRAGDEAMVGLWMRVLRRWRLAVVWRLVASSSRRRSFYERD
jgi:hypothetical protein